MMQRFLSVLVVALLSTFVTAQAFPNRAVRIAVPWPPNGNVDITARTIAPALGEALGQQVIVENRAGAGGTIGSTAVVKSPADGYTLVLGSSGTVRELSQAEFAAYVRADFEKWRTVAREAGVVVE